MNKEDRQHFTYRITQANPTELVVVLYEMLLCYLKEAEEALAAKEEDSFREAVRKSRGCLNELIESLNMQYEPAPRLMQLYLFCVRRLARCSVSHDAVLLEEIRRVVTPLWDAYRQIAGSNSAGPVMGNSQEVYVGLTYGKNTLTQNMADQGANRGMLA